MSNLNDGHENDPRGPEQLIHVNVHTYPEGMDGNSPIWRYMDLHAALSTVIHNTLRFTRVSKFRDEWESRRGAASRAAIDALNKAIADDSGSAHLLWPFELFDNFYRENNFVSSWTRVDPDQMLMWLAYTNSDASVALESTISSLAQTSTLNLNYADIGEINYVDPDIWVHSSGDNRELLYLKRPAFEFENEVRFAIEPASTHSPSGNPEDHVSLAIKENTVSKIIAHPYMPENTYSLLTDVISKFQLNVLVEKTKIADKPTY
jgi:hypothetical protein